MELKCPQCGKWMAVSQEELVIHDCQVVCPQCLAVCSYEGGALVVRDDSDAPYRHNITVETPVHETTRFCHSCGKQLPSGISFCPYCGVDLNAPFENEPVAPVEQPVPEAPKSAPAPVQQAKPSPAAPAEVTVHRPAVTSNHVEDKLRTVTHHYSSVHPHIYQNGTMPGTVFKIVAYTIIALLLALLVYIIIAGLSLEPAL